MLWNVPSAFLMGTLFTTFISWIRFPDKVSEGGLVSGHGQEGGQVQAAGRAGGWEGCATLHLLQVHIIQLLLLLAPLRFYHAFN
jgi:hypothetical protein